MKVRKFGDFGGRGEIEAAVVDDSQGMVFYSDEGAGIRRRATDPDDSREGSELALFGTQNYGGDHEGLALAEGRVVSTDQIAVGSRFHAYRDGQLEGTAATEADSTDGVEARSVDLGLDFPKGLAVVMNSKGRNFWLYRMPGFFLGAR
ncbi:MAG TPA: hypothetical protein VGK29_09690 [Paludibaculum sp.]